MESLERTPTPREMLFSLQQQVHKTISDQNEFYSELSKRIGGEAIEVDDADHLAKAAKIYDEDYTVVTRDEDGEVTDETNLLEVIKNKFEELSSKIKVVLENKDSFGDLISFLEIEQRQIHDDALFNALSENADTKIAGDLDVLSDWYHDILTQTIQHIDRIYQELELL